MFRPIRRKDRQIPDDEARQLLKNCKRAAFCVNGDGGYPFAMPINFYYHEEKNRIYFHSGKTGHKIDSIRADQRVCLSVWQEEGQKEGDWAFYVSSCVVYGRASLVEDGDEALEMIRLLAGKYYPTREEMEEEIEKDFHRVQMVSIDIEHLSGKRILEK